MADKRSITIGNTLATRRLIAAANRISAQLSDLGVNELVMPPKDRDPDYERMAQLTKLATWAESVADALEKEPLEVERSSDDSTSTASPEKSRRKR